MKRSWAVVVTSAVHVTMFFPAAAGYIGEQSYCRLDIDFDDVGCIQSHVPAHAVYTSNIRGVK